MSATPSPRRIRVLVVDDSVFMGMQIARMLNDDDEIEVVGRASDGIEALRRLEDLEPDVVTLDVDMPGMDGITTLKHIMVKRPVPTVMISALTGEGARATFDALRFGAIDVLPKPSSQRADTMEGQRDVIIAKVKRAAAIGIGRVRYARSATAPGKLSPGGPPDATTRFIGMGAGIGGYYSLLKVIPNLGPRFQDVMIAVIVGEHQHVESFSKYLQEHSLVPVTHAWDVDIIQKGVCYICAASDKVTLVQEDSGNITFDLQEEGEEVLLESGVDRMFTSIARVAGNRAIGVIMSGSGAEGVRGVAEIRAGGGIGIVQSLANCVDPSMPKAVLQSGAMVRSIPDFLMADFFMTHEETLRQAAVVPEPEESEPSNAAAASADFSGYIEGVDIIEYLQFLMLAGRPTVLEVVSNSGDRTHLFVRDGNVLHALAGGIQGEEALYRCLCARGGTFTNLPWREPAKNTIRKPGEFVLLEASRRRDEFWHEEQEGKTLGVESAKQRQ